MNDVQNEKVVKKGRPTKAAIAAKKVINKVIAIALEDGHPVQSAALKMCMDRVLPVSYFDKKNDAGGRNQVSITITGVGGASVTSGDTIDGEYEDVD